MSETIELRPCAFCGRNAQKILRSKIPDYHFFVKCGHCKAQTGEHASKKCAIYAWNYRDYLPYTPRHTNAAPGEAELLEALQEALPVLEYVVRNGWDEAPPWDWPHDENYALDVVRAALDNARALRDSDAD